MPQKSSSTFQLNFGDEQADFEAISRFEELFEKSTSVPQDLAILQGLSGDLASYSYGTVEGVLGSFLKKWQVVRPVTGAQSNQDLNSSCSTDKNPNILDPADTLE